MTMQEPKVEFEKIDVKDSVVAASIGGGQRCVSSQQDAQACADFDSSIPW